MDVADVLQQVFPGRSGASRSASKSSTTKSTTSKSSRTGSSGYGSGGGLSSGTSSMSSSGSAGALGSLGATSGSQRSGANPSRSQQTIVKPLASDSGRTAGGDDFAGTVEIIPDEANNAIVFKANSRDYRKVQTILKQIDIQPRQVIINVLVAEISLTGSVSYGIQWFLSKNIGSLGGSSGDYTVQGALDNNSGTSATTRSINKALGTSNGFFLTVYDPVDFLRGLISAIGSDSDVNVLSSPNILAIDNKEAVIEVGTDVPTVTGTTTSTTVGTTTSVQYRKTGILLSVTPHINSSGLVKMELVQEVSQVGTFESTLNNYRFDTRRADTSVVAEDNQTVVLAGLMTSNKKNSQSGIPYLKDIPVLGYFFGGLNKSSEKTELVFLITPHVIKNRSQADEITREFAQKVKDLQGISNIKKSGTQVSN
jgi:general secretion pathway protein D